MGLIEVELPGDAFAPGEELTGTVRWQLDGPAETIELRLFWYTRGKGGTDVGVVKAQRFDPPGPAGGHAFRFVLPDAPFSFSGKLISLVWAVEAIASPGKHTGRGEFVMAPHRREIQLQATTE